MNSRISEKIAAILNEAVSKKILPGANVLVFQDGAEVCYAEAGFADIENNIPIRRDTIFRLYSMTKPITGAAVMKLVETGALDLPDPVGKYLPGFQNQNVYTPEGIVPAKREVLIMDLLGMTSGLTYPDAGSPNDEAVAAVFASPDDPDTRTFANRLGQCGLAFHPGERWHYGTSADVAGAVIEAVTGRRFGQFLGDEFFAPLGMEDTGFYVPREKQNRLAKTWQQTGNGFRLYTIPHLRVSVEMKMPPAFESGGAGLASTVDDYMKFAVMLIKNGAPGILSPATAGCFTKPQLNGRQRQSMDWLDLQGYSYGKFMRVLEDPGQAMLIGAKGEYGWGGWLGANFVNDPVNGISLVFLTHCVGGGSAGVLRRIRNVIAASTTCP